MACRDRFGLGFLLIGITFMAAAAPSAIAHDETDWYPREWIAHEADEIQISLSANQA